MRTGAPTMKDVAREAGVALGTVSKVFNNIQVGEEYRVRVEAAAKRLGYQVNQYARGLRASHTFSVALILPSVDHPFFADLAEHVCAALAKRDYRMLLYLTGSNPEREQSCIQMVQQNNVDGIIALTYNPDLEITEGLPFVSIDRQFSASAPCVCSDNYSGGRLAAEKLIALGCRKIAFFRNGPRQPGEADKRGDGFEQACRTQDVNYEIVWVNDEEQGMEAFRDFLRGHMKGNTLSIDGIVCSTDKLAMTVKQMLEDLDKRVPEDVQLIGFDGIRHFHDGSYYCSTIVQPVAKLAETSVDLLLTKDRDNIPALICLPVYYAPGGTTRE